MSKISLVGKEELFAARIVKPKIAFALIGLLSFFTTVLYAVDFVSDFGTDYSVYFSNGWFMTRGLLPYSDFWTHKAPLLVMVIAGWISLFGHSMVSAVSFLIFVTIIASYMVYVLSSALEIGVFASVVSSLMFMFFVATHLLDPTRNGIIVIFAGIFEMLAVTNLIIGLKNQDRRYIAFSGFFLFLAFAARQTAAITYPGLIALIFITNRGKNLRQSLKEAVVLSLGSLVAAACFMAYFIINKISLDLIWNQIYVFNIYYAAGYKARLTDWVFGWMDIFQKAKLHILGFGVLAYFLQISIKAVKRAEFSIRDWTLIILFLLHSLAIYLQHKVQTIYFLQILPEASMMTAFVLTGALDGESTRNIKAFFKETSVTSYVIASLLVLLMLSLKDETIYNYTTMQAASEKGYLQNSENRPEYIVAQKVLELAPNSADRIWVLGFRDEIYMYADRLPAISHTNAARLQYVFSHDDYQMWLEEFTRSRPKVVVTYLTQSWMETAKNEPLLEDSGRSNKNLLKIAEFISKNMIKISYGMDKPEIYTWK